MNYNSLARIVDKFRPAPQPIPLREQVRSEHAEWSDATFGNVGPVGPLKHLSKEAIEAAAEPDEMSEWADMQFLLWDAQRRAGISDKQITLAMVEKLAVNKNRQWPEPKGGEPRLHIKAQSESVLPGIECDICGHVSTDPEGRTTTARITVMIDKYRLENMRRESGEKGELRTCRLKVTCIMP